MLKIHELTDDSGALTCVYLRRAPGEAAGFELVDAIGALPLPEGALEKVLARYGAPFDAEARITDVADLELGDGRSLRHVRHLAGYDVVPRDYLVLDVGDGELRCAHGATVAGALLHLARAYSSASSRGMSNRSSQR